MSIPTEFYNAMTLGTSFRLPPEMLSLYQDLNLQSQITPLNLSPIVSDDIYIDLFEPQEMIDYLIYRIAISFFTGIIAATAFSPIKAAAIISISAGFTFLPQLFSYLINSSEEPTSTSFFSGTLQP